LRWLHQACARARETNQLLALHFIDLDGFKQVNDCHGHIVGDELLRAVAQRIENAVRDTDTVARFGGDEFAVLQVGPSSLEFTEATARRICSAINRPYKIGGKSISVGASIGVACCPDDCANRDAMLAHADRALYRVKADGRNCVRVYEAAPDGTSGSGAGRKLQSPSAA